MVGRDWTTDEMEVAVTKGPINRHWNMIKYQKSKSRHGKLSAQEFAIIVRWDGTKQNPPSNFKFPPLEMILHKSRNIEQFWIYHLR